MLNSTTWTDLNFLISKFSYFLISSFKGPISAAHIAKRNVGTWTVEVLKLYPRDIVWPHKRPQIRPGINFGQNQIIKTDYRNLTKIWGTIDNS